MKPMTDGERITHVGRLVGIGTALMFGVALLGVAMLLRDTVLDRTNPLIPPSTTHHTFHMKFERPDANGE